MSPKFKISGCFAGYRRGATVCLLRWYSVGSIKEVQNNNSLNHLSFASLNSGTLEIYFSGSFAKAALQLPQHNAITCSL